VTTVSFPAISAAISADICAGFLGHPMGALGPTAAAGSRQEKRGYPFPF